MKGRNVTSNSEPYMFNRSAIISAKIITGLLRLIIANHTRQPIIYYIRYIATSSTNTINNQSMLNSELLRSNFNA